MSNISDKAYNELKGKREGQINWRIRKIKADLRRTVVSLESPRWDMTEEKFLQMQKYFEVKALALRENLNSAKRALVDLGFTYRLDRMEEKVLEFNGKLDNLVELTLKKGNGSRGYLTYKVKIDLDSASVESFDGVFGEKKCYELAKEGFLQRLKSLSVGEWKKCYEYASPVKDIDEDYWCLTFYFLDGESTAFGGVNYYPYNFKDLLNVLNGKV